MTGLTISLTSAIGAFPSHVFIAGLCALSIYALYIMVTLFLTRPSTAMGSLVETPLSHSKQLQLEKWAEEQKSSFTFFLDNSR